MGLVTEHIFWILILSGVLTFSMVQAVFAPERTIRSLFGETLPDSPAARLVIRSWGTVVAAGGVLLICAAFEPALREWVLIFLGFGKLCFAALIFSAGKRYARHQAMLAAVIDTGMVVLFALYLSGA